MEKENNLSDPKIFSEVDKVIPEDMQIAEIFNKFLVNIVPTLKILPKENYETDGGNDDKPILNYINKFKNHSSIKAIRNQRLEKITTDPLAFYLIYGRYLTNADLL